MKIQALAIFIIASYVHMFNFPIISSFLRSFLAYFALASCILCALLFKTRGFICSFLPSTLSSCWFKHILSIMESSLTRKNLWLLIRKDYPRIYVKFGQDFEKVVRDSLIKLLKLVEPISVDQDEFVKKETNIFAKEVPYMWQKSKRNLKHMFSRHDIFFEKAYPQFTSVSEPINPLKRPHEEKSKSQQWRDKAKISQEIDKNAVISSAAYCFQKDGHPDAAFVVKRLQKEPSAAKMLRKTLEDMDSSNPEKRSNISILEHDSIYHIRF